MPVKKIPILIFSPLIFWISRSGIGKLVPASQLQGMPSGGSNMLVETYKFLLSTRQLDME